MSTSEFRYEDDQCFYLGGDPRLETPQVKDGILQPREATLILKADAVQLKVGNEDVYWPKASLIDANIQKADYGDNIIKPLPVVEISVRDPESVYKHGFLIEVTFRNLYYARVFLKRLSEAFPGVVRDEVTGLSTDMG